MNNLYFLFIIVFSIFASAQEKPEVKKANQEAIIKEYLENCAYKYDYTVNMFE